MTRHRLASFDVESQRYVKLEDVRMVMPDSIARSEFLQEAEACLTGSMGLYKRMIAEGIPPEDARYITPQAVVTNLLVTMNARELRHFFKLRCCNRAQWEIREMAGQMLRLCLETAPVQAVSAVDVWKPVRAATDAMSMTGTSCRNRR